MVKDMKSHPSKFQRVLILLSNGGARLSETGSLVFMVCLMIGFSSNHTYGSVDISLNRVFCSFHFCGISLESYFPLFVLLCLPELLS